MVLGSSCSVPRPGRASSSYLLRMGGRTIVADFGTGAFANLVRYVAPDAVDDVVISHLHADHFLDVVPYRYALKYGARTTPRKVRVWIPPGARERLDRVAAVFDDEGGGFFDDVFEVATYDPHAGLELGDVRVTFARTTHFIDCYAMRFESAGVSVTYSADTAPDPAVAELARGSTYFLCEATLTEAEEGLEPRGHISPREAGALAAAAAAKALVLTHYPANVDAAALTAAASTTFAGRIVVADDGLALPLP